MSSQDPRGRSLYEQHIISKTEFRLMPEATSGAFFRTNFNSCADLVLLSPPSHSNIKNMGNPNNRMVPKAPCGITPEQNKAKLHQKEAELKKREADLLKEFRLLLGTRAWPFITQVAAIPPGEVTIQYKGTDLRLHAIPAVGRRYRQIQAQLRDNHLQLHKVQLHLQYDQETMAPNPNADACSFSSPPHCERFVDVIGENYDPSNPLSEISQWDYDTWLTEEELDDDRDIPRIPAVYAREQAEGRVISVRGIPKCWMNEGFQYIMAHFGTVEKLPCLISLTGGGVFRWAIMSTAAEAHDAFDGLYMFPLQKKLLVTSIALKPGLTTRLMAPQHVPDNPNYDEDESARLYAETIASYSSVKTVHGHPSPSKYTDVKGKEKENVAPIGERSTPAKPVAIPRDFTPSSSVATKSFTPSSSATATPKTAVRNSSIAVVPENAAAIPSISNPASAEATTSTQPAMSTPVTTSPAPFVTVASSWANIAQAANPNTNVIDLHPNRVPQGHRLHPVGRIPAVVRTSAKSAESQAEEMRIVFLLNLPHSITGQDITAGVQEGPIVRYKFGFTEDANPRRYCGIVFLYAKHAEVFHKVLQEEKRMSRPERFRFVMEEARGDLPEPLDDTIMAMLDPKINATRRLTIVKKGFFFVMNERRLVHLCNKTVGEELVELVWLYNGGNATVVFTDVSAAIKMKAEFDRLAASADMPNGEAAIWAGLQTSFSKDPCQVPLVLSTALTAG